MHPWSCFLLIPHEISDDRQFTWKVLTLGSPQEMMDLLHVQPVVTSMLTGVYRTNLVVSIHPPLHSLISTQHEPHLQLCIIYGTSFDDHALS